MPKSTHVDNYVTKEDAIAEPVMSGSEVCSRCYQNWYLHDTPDDGSPVPWLSCVKALRHRLDYYRSEASKQEQRVKDLQTEMIARVWQAKSDATEYANAGQRRRGIY